MAKTIIEQLGHFVEELRFEHLPSDVVRKANDCFFDFVGCYYAAMKYGDNEKILNAILNINPRPDVHVWGTGRKCGIAEAALAIGCLGYHLEYDDGISVAGHWGSASIPATFLSAQYHGKSGEDFITAVVAAYEVGTRISRIYSPRLLKNHVHFPCTMGAFAAAAGFSKAADLTKEEISGALSLAGLFPLGTYSTAISGAQGKDLYSGWPNYLGINVVRFSQMGLRGDSDILENEYGFGTALGLGSVSVDAQHEILKGLGREFRIMEVYFKPYPSCRWLHAPVYAVLRLMKQHRVDRDSISEIIIYGPEFTRMYDIHEGFESKVACQYSIPYTVGAAAFFGKVGLEEFEDTVRSDSEFLDFVQKVHVEVDDELQRKFPAEFSVRIKILLTDGSSIETEQGHPWGPQTPAKQEELINKFRYLTSNVLSTNEQDEWIACYKIGFEHDAEFEKVSKMLARKNKLAAHIKN